VTDPKDIQAVLRNAHEVTGVDLEALRLCLVLRNATRTILKGLDAHFDALGLSQHKFAILADLYREEGDQPGASELAETLGITRASMTALLRQLEGDGLLKRHAANQDRRRQTLRLTAKGRRFMEKILPTHYQRMTALTGHLNQREAQTLERIIDKLNRGVADIHAQLSSSTGVSS
jgi:DNA-binding MarR family transcriptional regulator